MTESLLPTSAVLYGKGVFTTVAVFGGKPFLWEKHLQRLSDHATKIVIDLSEFSNEMISESVSHEIEKSGLVDGRVRVTLSDETSSAIWPSDAERKTSLSVITGERREVAANFRLTTSPYIVNSQSPLAGIKSCNYLDKILTLNEAKGRGFDEAVQINERGHITSAAMANIFWLKDEVLYTPGLKTGCLAGTTRELVMENLDCREVEADMETLEAADAIFLTSAGLGVTRAAEFGSKRFDDLDHPIMHTL